MRKICSVWLVAGILVFALTFISCAKKVTITYWSVEAGANPIGETMRRLIAEYNKTHPDVYVKVLQVATTSGQVQEKLISAIAGGVPPDVADLDPTVLISWVIKGAVQPITKFVKRDGIDVEKEFYRFAIEPLIYKGEIYELPRDGDGRAIFYNKKLFREAGLDPNKPPRTIAELDEYAEKLTVKDAKGRYKRIGFIPWYGDGWLLTDWGQVFGGEIYDPETNKVKVNEEPYVRALTWMCSYAKKYGLTAIRSFTKAFGSGAMDPFITGRIAMKSDGNWCMLNLKKYAPDLDYGVVPWPKAPGGPEVAQWSSGWAECIPVGAKHPEEAWELIKWMAGEHFQTEWCLGAGKFPSNKKAAADPRFRKAFGGRQAVFMDTLPYAKCYPPSGFAAPMLLWDEMIAATDYALEGKKTPKQALDDVAKKVNAAIAPYPPK